MLQPLLPLSCLVAAKYLGDVQYVVELHSAEWDGYSVFCME